MAVLTELFEVTELYDVTEFYDVKFYSQISKCTCLRPLNALELRTEVFNLPFDCSHTSINQSAAIESLNFVLMFIDALQNSYLYWAGIVVYYVPRVKLVV